MKDKKFWVAMFIIQSVSLGYFLLSYKISCVTIAVSGYPIIKQECSIERK